MLNVNTVVSTLLRDKNMFIINQGIKSMIFSNLQGWHSVQRPADDLWPCRQRGLCCEEDKENIHHHENNCLNNNIRGDNNSSDAADSDQIVHNNLHFHNKDHLNFQSYHFNNNCHYTNNNNKINYNNN